jgi:hypothetical protein
MQAIMSKCSATKAGSSMREDNMSTLRFGRFLGWFVLAVVGSVAAVYFLDSTRRAALTQTAGWFLNAFRFILSGMG